MLRRLNILAPGIALALLLAACNDDKPSWVPPLHVSVAHKQLQFDWDASGTDASYNVGYSFDGGRTYNGGLIPYPLTVPLSAHLIDWNQAWVQLFGCTPGNCSASAPVPLRTLANDAVGVLNSEHPQIGNEFGSQVSLSRDGQMLAISEPFSGAVVAGTAADCDSLAPVNCLANSGSVSIYRREDNRWVLEATLKASNAGEGDAFGEAMMISHAGDMLIVGAPYEDSAATGIGTAPPADNCNGLATEPVCAADSGAVYVFSRSGTLWSQTAYIKPMHVGAGDHFGDEVAFRNGTLVVGAMYEDSAATGMNGDPASDCTAAAPVNCRIDSGAAYIFSLPLVGAPQWHQSMYLKQGALSDPTHVFGAMVAVSGDGNAVAVAAGHNDDVHREVAMFRRNGTDWHTDSSVAFDGATSDTVIPALDFGGFRLAVGLPGIGAVQTAVYASGEWSVFRAIITPSRYVDRFGKSVAFNDDGTLLVIGAPMDSGDGTGLAPLRRNNCLPTAQANCAQGSGAAYVFRDDSSSATWREILHIKPPASEHFFAEQPFYNDPSFDMFGHFLALSGDGRTLAIASYADDSGQSGFGGDTSDGCEQVPAINCVANSGSVLIY